ncbi:MAG: Ada metal-binding domain-containing protein [Bacteroidota bacterium]
MIKHTYLSASSLFRSIKSGKITLGGNKKLKIYGRLNCRSGKRMNQQNRVFFIHEEEAVEAGYRPCSHCMRAEYKKWKTKREDSNM